MLPLNASMGLKEESPVLLDRATHWIVSLGLSLRLSLDRLSFSI